MSTAIMVMADVFALAMFTLVCGVVARVIVGKR